MKKGNQRQESRELGRKNQPNRIESNRVPAANEFNAIAMGRTLLCQPCLCRPFGERNGKDEVEE